MPWLLLIAPLAQAAGASQSSSEAFTIYGPQPLECTVDLERRSVRVDLTSAAKQSLGRVSYVCNSPAGITRKVSSQNGGSLMRESQAIAYTVEQDGSSALSFLPTRLSTPLTTTISSDPNLVTGVTEELGLRVTGDLTRLVAGEYRDNVTIEIAPN